MTTCQKCGLLQFAGAARYAGPECRCLSYFAPQDPNRPNQTREFVPVDEATVRRIIRERTCKGKAMTDLTARLCSHDDPRLYREADELMQEAAAELIRMHVELDRIRSDRDCEKRLRKDAEEAREVLTAQIAIQADIIKRSWDSQEANARASAMEEAAVIADDWGDAREPARGGDALKNCAAAIRAAITKGAKP